MTAHPPPQRRRDSLGRLSAACLQLMDFHPLRFAVPGLLPEGLAILAGRPKFGKSFLCLGLAVAVASGGKAFGSIDCPQGDVLYLALEDSERRLKDRLGKMLPYDDWPTRLEVMTQAPRLGRGLEDEIASWAEEVEAPRLVIIDTWRCIKPPSRSGQGGYDEDAGALAPLHELAKAHPGLTILMVHHTRKMDAEDPFDTISGTFGLTGVADTLMVIASHGEGVKLSVQGRDLEGCEKALQRDAMTGGWSIVGDARELAKTRERQDILDLLDEAAEDEKPLTLAQIASTLGKPKSTLGTLLKRLEGEGLIEKASYGKYQPAPHRSRRNRRNFPEANGYPIEKARPKLSRGDAREPKASTGSPSVETPIPLKGNDRNGSFYSFYSSDSEPEGLQ